MGDGANEVHLPGYAIQKDRVIPEREGAPGTDLEGIVSTPGRNDGVLRPSALRIAITVMSVGVVIVVPGFAVVFGIKPGCNNSEPWVFKFQVITGYIYRVRSLLVLAAKFEVVFITMHMCYRIDNDRG